MFFEDFTPLLASPDQIRPGRLYPGGRHLDQLVGPKEDPEPGWFYPEAWIFSPKPAINPGSQRTSEGLTFIYDKQGRRFAWDGFIEQNGESVLGDRELKITVKMLDSDCMLAKEFHFKESDQATLRLLRPTKDFKGPLIKPEVWIRHPDAAYSATPPFVGFKDSSVDREKLRDLAAKGPHQMQAHMNEVVMAPGDGLLIRGGVVHSLNQGLYFEVMAAGDCRVLLQERFQGKDLLLEERFGPLYSGSEGVLDDALVFVDLSCYGAELIGTCTCVPRQLDDYKKLIASTPDFTVEWICVPAGRKYSVQNKPPHVLVAASGNGRIISNRSVVKLRPGPHSFATFSQNKSCGAVIVHASIGEYVIENQSNDDLVLLVAHGGKKRSGVS